VEDDVVSSTWRADAGAAITTLLCSLALGTLAATSAAAQKKAPEFTRQGLLIPNFAPRGTADFGYGRKTADEVRSRVSKLSNKREVDVISGGDIR
jgi:hypothetical protein